MLYYSIFLELPKYVGVVLYIVVYAELHVLHLVAFHFKFSRHHPKNQVGIRHPEFLAIHIVKGGSEAGVGGELNQQVLAFLSDGDVADQRVLKLAYVGA